MVSVMERSFCIKSLLKEAFATEAELPMEEPDPDPEEARYGDPG